MQIGLLTDSLSSVSREHALDAAVELGVETVEIGLGGVHGGWSPAPHADLVEMKDSSAARSSLLTDIRSRGLRLEALNASGNPLHPVHSERDADILRSAIRLAVDLDVETVVAMSGLPGAPGDRFPAWVTTVWPPENLELLDHQWNVALEFWTAIAEQAARCGVKVAIEMHANQLVYNVPGLLKLTDAVGPAIGANFDPSHLIWMGAVPIEALKALRGRVYHVHAKDTRIEELASVSSRLETTPNEKFDQRAWNYVAVGTGHPDGVEFWRALVDTLREIGYDGPLSIENEDYSLPPRESVGRAVDTLKQALEPRGA